MLSLKRLVARTARIRTRQPSQASVQGTEGLEVIWGVYRGYIGIASVHQRIKRSRVWGLHRGYVVIMEKKMATGIGA